MDKSSPSTFNDYSPAVDKAGEFSTTFHPTENSSAGILKVNSFELGDLILIDAPTNPQLHDYTFFIKYIDEEKIKLVNLQDRSLIQLNMNDNQEIKDESIRRIILKSRSKEKGFARQMGLLPDKWVNIHFGGEFPRIDVGQITNLEEDMIEVTILSENLIYYIDFEYKGIPEYLPLEKIVIRNRPSILKNDDVINELNGELKNPRNLSVAIESVNQKIAASLDTDEPVESEPDSLAPSIGSKSPANIEPDAYIPNLLTAMYLDANDILEENIGEYVQLVEVGEKEKRYTLETQVSNIADKLIAKIPVAERTASVAEKIQNIISKFKQLRTKYSVLDENGNVVQPRRLNAFHKPIIDKIAAFERKLEWIMPVVYAQKKVFFDVLDEGEGDGGDENSKNPAIYYEKADETIANDERAYTEYKNKKIGRGERALKYDKLLEDIDRGFHPYVNSEGGYAAQATMCIDAIIEHLDAFQSYTVSNILKGRGGEADEVLIKPADFITTRFIDGQSKIVTETTRSGKKTQKRNKVTENEQFSVKSLVMMPESVVKYSRVNLPSTGILTRAELAMTELHLSRVLNNSVKVDNVVVYDLNKQVAYDEDGDEDADANVMPRFLNKVRHYLVGGDISIETREKFEEFLNSIFPNIRTLIRLMEKYMTDCFSLLKIVEMLEPFAIYSDTISFNQYKEIRYFLKEKIKKEKVALNEKSKEFFNYSQIAAGGDNGIADWAEDFFRSNKNYLSWLKKTYGVLDNADEVSEDAGVASKTSVKRTGSETMGLLNSVDNCAFMSKLVNHRMFSLITPDNVMNVIETGKNEDIGEIEEKTKCGGARLFLSKKYKSIAAMQKDNGIEELEYDKEFDDTPYHILDMYKGKQKEMQEDKFMEFFSLVLEEKHGCPHHLAKPLAKTIIRGKKLVAAGDYALVEVSDIAAGKYELAAEKMPIKPYYYKRHGTVWVHDKDIEDQAFMDTNQLFCNLKTKKGDCVQQSSGVADQHMCLDNKQAIANMQSLLKTKVLKEFDKRLEISLEELKEKIEKELIYMREYVERCRRLKLAELYHTNNVAYRLGRNEHISHGEPASIQSPYIELRDMILSLTDYVKKQDDIVLFNEVYTREPSVEQGENKYWLYCKETNTKLFPFSLFKLASAFKYDYDKYPAAMSAVIREVGTMSEDGEAIIDKYTNYELKKIDFAEQELYDEQGFRIHTHEVAEEDTVKQVASALSEKLVQTAADRVFEDETTQIMYNISVKLLRDMGVPKDAVDDLQTDALTIAKPMVAKIIGEKEYDKKKKEGEKNTGKKSTLPPYEMYRDKMLIFLSACACLIVVQTKVPNVRLVKTFPGCVRATDGFPLDMDGEKMGGMKYIACILLKLAAKVRPWNAIEQIKNVEAMVKNMRTVMEERYLKTTEIQAKYAAKRDYIRENPIVDETSVPKEHAVEKWVNFMPPLIEYSIEKTLQSVSSDFKKELITMMRNGHRDQDVAINVLRSKILAHTYGIAELINKIVKQREPLLTTRSGNVPFMENACCNETASKTAFSYFAGEDANVDVFNKRCKNMSVLLTDVKMLSKPATLYHPLPTNIQYKKVPDEYVEETIYSAIIHYCKLDRPVPIPDAYHSLLTDKIPGYDRGSTIKEKMETMKSNGKVFGVDHLNQLMTIVNRANAVEGISFAEKPIVQMAGLKEFIVGLDELDSSKPENNIIDAKLRRLILDAIGDYKPTIIVAETRTSEDLLRRHLRKMNTEMQEGVFLFLQENGNLDSKIGGMVRDFLQGGVEEWNLEEEEPAGVAKMRTAEHGLYTIAQYVKSSIYSLVKMYPSQIKNRHVHNTDAIPQHWKLSANNKTDLELWFKKTLAGLTRFEEDIVVGELIGKIERMFVNLSLFMDILPLLAPIYRWSEKEQRMVEFYSFLSKSTYLLLLKYCWLSVWHGYVVAIDARRMRELEHKLNLQEKINMRETEVAASMEAFIAVDDLEMDIVAGMDKNAKRIVGELMVELMKIEMRTKSMFNLSYSEIEKKIYKTREDEKREITDYLGGMDDEERAVENMLKKFKLGRWGVGLDKSLFKYDRERYDKERETTNQRLRDELMGVGENELFVGQINALNGVGGETGESMTAEEMDAAEGGRLAAEYDLEDREIRVEEEYMGEFDEYDEGFDEE